MNPNRSRARRAPLLSALLGLGALGLWAQTPSIQQAPRDPRPTYSPNADVDASLSLTIVNNSYVGPISLVFTELSRSPQTLPPAEPVSCGLLSADGLQALATSGSPSSAAEVLGGSFPAGSGKKERLSLDALFRLRPSTLPPSGNHVISYRVDLYASAFPLAGAIAATEFFDVTVRVGSYFDVSVVPSGGAFSLSSTSQNLGFGSLLPGEARGVDVLVKSNVAYTLSLASSGQGAFVSAFDGSRLPYALTVNGSPVSLGASAVLASGAAPGYAAPSRYALLVTVQPYAELPTEGDYADTLTLTLSAP